MAFEATWVVVISLILVGGSWLVGAQCNGGVMEINNGTGTIQSPNYPSNEYGKAANCSWKLMLPEDGKHHKLTMTIAYQRLYFVVPGGGSEKNCSGNYLLAINNVTQDCKYYSPGMGLPTYTYSHTNVCGNVDQQHLHVLVQYSSEGKRFGETNQTSMGFKIEYKYEECVETTTIKRSGPCDGAIKVINSSEGTIQSPNKGNEYGKSANCSWKFLPPQSDKNFTLTLSIFYQRLYFVSNDRKKICSGSYNLSIDGDTQPCERYVDLSYRTAPTFEFSDSMQCKKVSTSSLTDGVVVKYISDGRTLADANKLSTGMGFQIKYKYAACLDEAQMDVNQTNETGLKTTSSEATTGPADTDGGKMTQTTLLLLVSIPGFVGILILTVTAILFCRKSGDNSSQKKPKDNEATDENQTEMGEISHDEKKLGHNSVEADEPGSSDLPNAEGNVDHSLMYAAVVRNTEDGNKATIHL